MNNTKGMLTASILFVLALLLGCASDDGGENHDVVSSSGGLSSSSDAENIAYDTVIVGSQVWMKKNLNVETYDSKCYDYDPDNCDKYGRLYTWKEANNVCPGGWHLPNDAEWDALFSFADGTDLKAKDGWDRDGNGDDAYGFAALPGGGYDHFGGFYDLGSHGYWWSSSEYDNNVAYYRYMVYDKEYAYLGYEAKTVTSLSVRCIKGFRH